MDERINDYNNYDKLVLYVRNKKVKDIIKYYNALGYELVLNEDNRKYSDTKDLTFIRPHKIENKDRLQLLQVHLEVELNKMGRAEQYKHSLSVNFALSLGLIGLFFLVFGIYKLLIIPNITQKIFYACMLFSGGLFAFLILFFTPKIIKKENKKFNKQVTQINNNINFILIKIKEARGVECQKEPQ